MIFKNIIITATTLLLKQTDHFTFSGVQQKPSILHLIECITFLIFPFSKIYKKTEKKLSKKKGEENSALITMLTVETERLKQNSIKTKFNFARI